MLCPNKCGPPSGEVLGEVLGPREVRSPRIAQDQDIFADVTIQELAQMAWFPNEFQVALMHHSNLSQGASPINDMAQKEIFGCKAFAGAVPTWSEVSNRLIYIAHNMQRLDTGSEPFFGALGLLKLIVKPYQFLLLRTLSWGDDLGK